MTEWGFETTEWGFETIEWGFERTVRRNESGDWSWGSIFYGILAFLFVISTPSRDSGQAPGEIFACRLNTHVQYVAIYRYKISHMRSK